MLVDAEKTKAVRGRYDRNARTYDLMEGMIERLMFRRWRKTLWGKVEGPRVLEIGVGTGKNLPYHPAKAEITALDFSEKMLARAMDKAKTLGTKASLLQMDAQNLEFEKDTFDTVVATFVFCSVPDPLLGLQEVQRVCKPGGQVLLLEHVRSANPLLGKMMDFANPLMVRVSGANMNRRTIDNVARSGLVIERVTHLRFGIFKLIEARVEGPNGRRSP